MKRERDVAVVELLPELWDAVVALMPQETRDECLMMGRLAQCTRALWQAHGERARLGASRHWCLAHSLVLTVACGCFYATCLFTLRCCDACPTACTRCGREEKGRVVCDVCHRWTCLWCCLEAGAACPDCHCCAACCDCTIDSSDDW